MHSSIVQLALALFALCAPAFVNATRTQQRCFIEPFPGMLQAHIADYRACGLKNPFVIDFVCEPVRGVVPDAEWLKFQLEQFEDENAVESHNINAAPSVLEAMPSNIARKAPTNAHFVRADSVVMPAVAAFAIQHHKL